MSKGSSVLSPAMVARVESTCFILGLKGRDAEMIAGICQIARVEGYVAGMDEAIAIMKAPPKRDNVVDLDVEKLARRYEGVGDAPCDTTPGGSAA